MSDPSPETPPKSGSKRRKFDEAAREAVILSGTIIMKAVGLDGMKARPIAQSAGISVGTLYNMFGDLDGLIRVINGRVYDALYQIESAALTHARAEGLSAREQMLALAAAYLEFVESHQTEWQAVLGFNRIQTDPPPDWYLQKELALFRIIEDAIVDFPKARTDITRRNHARALWASIHGIVSLAVADGFLMQPIEDVSAQTQIIVNAVAASLE